MGGWLQINRIGGVMTVDQERISVLESQLEVAVARAQRFRDMLLRLAARADDYSGPCIRAHVADALEVTVKELEEMIRE
jgi:hypothetical protein